MLAYSITPIPCNEVHLRSGRILEPIVIEDVPSSVTEERMNEQFENLVGTTNPIIEDVETHVETPIETLAETHIETTPGRNLRNPPYLERLALQKYVEKPCFNLLGELKNLYVKIPLLQALHDVPIYAKTVRDMSVKKSLRKPKDPLIVHVVGKLSE